jgi:hypothetical protein
MRGLTMGRLLSWSGCLMLLVSSGCAMCANPYDDSYAAYGGRRERTDMVHGRVGSVFDPAPEIIHEVPQEQSPQPATPEPPETPETTETPTPDRPSIEAPLELDGLPEEDVEPDTELPELPNGTIELPELEPGQMPAPDDLPAPGEVPPDIQDDNRSAKRHPLADLFDEDF